MSDHDQPEEPASHRHLACYRAYLCGAWRLEEALRLLGELRRRRPRQRGPLDSPSGFHAR